MTPFWIFSACLAAAFWLAFFACNFLADYTADLNRKADLRGSAIGFFYAGIIATIWLAFLSVKP